MPINCERDFVAVRRNKDKENNFYYYKELNNYNFTCEDC